MARIRTIKPEFFRSPDTAKASPRARLLYIAMWSWADDYGVGEWTPRELLGFAFPHDDDVTVTDFQRLCKEVADVFGTEFYTVRGRRFYCIPAWDDHQKTERRAAGKHPRPDDKEAAPDQDFCTVKENRGNSASTQGKTPAGKGTGEQGNRGKGTGETSPAVPDRDLTSLFSSAWSHWPKKVERKEALARFKQATKKIHPNELAYAIATFGDAYAETTERQFVPALGAWLNGERWTDELPRRAEPERKTSNAQRALSVVEHFARQEQGALGA